MGKKGWVKEKEEAARKQGQAQIFGVANKVTREESVWNWIKRKVLRKELFKKE